MLKMQLLIHAGTKVNPPRRKRAPDIQQRVGFTLFIISPKAIMCAIYYLSGRRVIATSNIRDILAPRSDGDSLILRLFIFVIPGDTMCRYMPSTSGRYYFGGCHIPTFRITVIFSCDQSALWIVQSVSPSVRPSRLFHYFPIMVSSWKLLSLTEVVSMQMVKVRVQRSKSQRSKSNLAVSRP